MTHDIFLRLSHLGCGVGLLLLLASMTGCIAKSSHVDKLSEAQAETAGIVANLADSYAKLAKEVESIQAPRAEKIANAAEIHAANSLDLSDEGSAHDLSGAASKALTGDWVGLGGLIVSALMGGYGYQQNRKAKKTQRIADLNAQLADEVADLEPPIAREVLKSKRKSA
jgi:hypothetical protein